MLSLVNYDSSDDEDVESSEPRDSTKVATKEVPHNDSSNKLATTSSETTTTIPKVQIGLGLDRTSVTKTSNGRVQIKLAPLDLVHQEDDSDSDEEERQRKRLKRSEKGSGLISLLPKPKLMQSKPKKTSLTSLIPNSVSNRAKTQNFKHKSSSVDSSSFRSNVLYNNNEEEDEYDANNLINATSTSDTAPVYGPSKPATVDNEAYSSLEHIDPNEDVTYKKFIASKFDDESSNIKIIDVDLSKHLSENKEWLKNISVENEKLTDEDIKGETPNSTARRKNQITFLAYQAKKREIELKNQWAANRVTKNQTRAKYGF